MPPSHHVNMAQGGCRGEKVADWAAYSVVQPPQSTKTSGRPVSPAPPGRSRTAITCQLIVGCLWGCGHAPSRRLTADCKTVGVRLPRFEFLTRHADTQLEFEAAGEAALPRLVFLLDEDAQDSVQLFRDDDIGPALGPPRRGHKFKLVCILVIMVFLVISGH
jgi:hypothetical protein